MATSQNGWPVIESGTDPRLAAVPRIAGRVRSGDVATVAAYVIARFDAEVEDVDVGADDWGWAYRAIRGQVGGYSNHASGTAWDLNATRHPLGRRGTFTAQQAAAIRRIVADVNAAAGTAVLRWGGDYRGRPDEMHFEVVGSPAAIARAAAAIRGGRLVSNDITTGGAIASAPDLAPPEPITPEDEMIKGNAIRTGDGSGSIGLLNSDGTLAPLSGEEYAALLRVGFIEEYHQESDGTVWNILAARTARVHAATAGDANALAAQVAALVVPAVMAGLPAGALTVQQVQDAAEAAMRDVLGSLAS